MDDDEPVSVRRLRGDDWELTRRLRLRALAADGRWFGGQYAMALQRTRAQWRDWPNGAVFALFVAGQPHGLIAGTRPDYLDGEAELISMWVDPAVRGRGLAARLIDAVADWARDGGGDHLYLEVMPDNDSAIRAYARHGFAATDVTVRDPAHFRMRLPLRAP